MNIQSIISFFQDLQNEICTSLEQEEGAKSFHEDTWQHKTGGGGKTRVMQGSIIEKAGVNFSHVSGPKLPAAAACHLDLPEDNSFEATGLSLVIHPQNPYAPTAHMNLRFFQVNTSNHIWWFGGGLDLTPYYGFEEDCIHWHQMAKRACLNFGGEATYRKFKKQCDDYFYLKHRKEPRGIGGLFFDELNQPEFNQVFEFIQAVGQHFLLAYLPILQRRKNTAYTTDEKQFQKYRRGRYVEFNLIYDRGTLFGLESGARTESIFISLPPEVSWRYNWQPESGTREHRLYTDFLPPKDWV